MPKQGEMDANKSSKAMWNTGIEMLQDNMTKKELKSLLMKVNGESKKLA